MNTEQFVKEYNEATDKEKFVKKHILKDKYIPYAEKVAICSNITQLTLYTEVDGKKIFKKNSANDYLFFTLELIDKYTDIEISKKNALNEFDLLDSNNCIDILISFIPEHEKQTMQVIKKMTVDDEMINNRDLTSYLDNKSSAIEMMLDTSLEEIISKVGK